MEVSKEEDEPKTPRDKIIDNDTVNAAKTIQKYVREYQKKPCLLHKEILRELKKFIPKNYGHETQMTSKLHEKHTYNIFKNTLCCKELSKQEFKKLINKSKHKWKSKPQEEDDLIRKCNYEIGIINNCINLVNGTNYIVYQPSGSQDFPDILLLNYDDDKLKLYYIECKQSIPKFNNNPPKMKKNVLYVCGHQLYCGFLLSTPKLEERIKEFKKKYCELVDEYKSDEIKIVPYKVIERDWKKDEGPKCFRKRKEENIPLINKYFNYFINDNVKK